MLVILVFEPIESPSVDKINPSDLYKCVCEQKDKWLSNLDSKMCWVVRSMSQNQWIKIWSLEQVLGLNLSSATFQYVALLF